jgi:uncharacterized protein YacL (UPF0231 family)
MRKATIFNVEVKFAEALQDKRLADKSFNASDLVNKLLGQYFGEDVHEESKKIDEQLNDLQEKKEKLEKVKTEEEEKTLMIKKLDLPEFMIEWLKVRTEKPGLIEVVNKLKAEGLETNEERRLQVWRAWEKLHAI